MQERTHAAAQQMGLLSIVIPAYNSAEWLPRTVEHLEAAVEASGWPAEVVIVDDGSTDATREVAGSLGTRLPVRVVSQPNRGRFLARKRGLDEARGAYVLLLDSRVEMLPSSLTYLAEQIAEHPERRVWNGHVESARAGNIYARFWWAIVCIWWRRYLAQPRLVSYGIDDFDYYPKGTTCFFAPKALMIESFRSFRSLYDDLRLANDDTAMLRSLARHERIHLGPGFAAIYHSRTSMRAFLKHSFHRGTVLVDGFMCPGTRLFLPLIVFLVATPFAVALIVAEPLLVAAAVAVLAAIGLSVLPALGISFKDATALVALAPVFAVVYGAGIWRGVGMALWRRVVSRA